MTAKLHCPKCGAFISPKRRVLAGSSTAVLIICSKCREIIAFDPSMDCKCGHYQYAHNYGKYKCNMPKCKCLRYREKPNLSLAGQPHSEVPSVSDRTGSES